MTGSNKGIGNGIVELLARHYKSDPDWHIYLTSRNEKLGLEAVKVMEGKGLSVKYHQLDITDEASRKRLAEFLKANYPDGINILVNNAGIAYKVSVEKLFCLNKWLACLHGSLRRTSKSHSGHKLHGDAEDVHGVPTPDGEEVKVCRYIIRDTLNVLDW